jgi:quercetin dioxygenase-like cupin family protein
MELIMTLQRPKAIPTVQLDDDRVCTTLWRFTPGAETGWHRHGHAYVVVPLADGELLLEEPGGSSRIVSLSLGGSYTRDEGVEHNVVNPSMTDPFAFVEIELKRRGS